jgi:hypothetical protein
VSGKASYENEVDNWHTLVTRTNHPKPRPYPGSLIERDHQATDILKVDPSEMVEREYRCRAVYKSWHENERRWQRCKNIAYLDIFIDPDETFDGKPRVALCFVHASVHMRGNLRICR